MHMAMPTRVAPKIARNAKAIFMLSVTLSKKKSIQRKTLIIVSRLVNIAMIDIVSAYIIVALSTADLRKSLNSFLSVSS